MIRHASPDLRIAQREKEGIALLDLAGRVTIGESEMLLREYAAHLTEAGVKNAIVNCSDITEIDSDGITALDLCGAMFRDAGGAMKLTHLKSVPVTALGITEMYAGLDVFDDEQDAINSFFPSRAIQSLDILRFLENQNRQDKPQ